MADCFISYRRTPSGPVALVIQGKLASDYGLDAYVDTTRKDSTQVRFPERLMQAIDDAPVFVCLLGERDGQHTLQSEWVLKEIQKAYTARKFCIPVFQESYRPLPDTSPAVDYLLSFDGVHILDQKNVMIDATVRELADLIRPHRRRSPARWRVIGGLMVILLALSGVLIATSDWFAPAEEGDVALTEMTAETPGESGAVYDTPTRAAQLNTPPPTHAPTKTPLSPAPSATPTPTATALPPTPTLSRVQIATTPVASNAAWQPYITESEFAGVRMMLVPAGAFLMGSTDAEIDAALSLCSQSFNDCQRAWFEDEPLQTRRFDQPFWIDKVEVTRAMYQQCVNAGACQYTPNPTYATSDSYPITRVTWQQAQAYCEWRGGRLPTEAEWEYAARGPDHLIFPWGNSFDGNKLNYCDAACTEVWADSLVNDGFGFGPAPVGTYLANRSWVGAMDMSGNVYEWVSMDTGPGLRGGSYTINPGFVRTAVRANFSSASEQNDWGFRCVRTP